MLALAWLLSGCCGNAAPPALTAPVGAQTDVGRVWELPLAELSDEADTLEWSVTAGEHLDVGISGDSLYAIPQEGWSGRETITVTASDRCGYAEASFELGVGALGGACEAVITWTGSAGAVEVAGAFNDWGRTALTEEAGAFSVRLPLAPGAYPYKLVVDGGWTCDPANPRFQCDEGYDRGAWGTCAPGAASCNSLLVVPDCAKPALSLTDLEVTATGARLEIAFSPSVGGAPSAGVSATLDGDAVALEGDLLVLTGLSPGRHTVRVEATDADGAAAEPLHVPLWTDGSDWQGGLMYYAFVDRFANGDPGNDRKDGSSPPWTDWHGGDWQGVIDRLDWLDDLGVTAIWLTAPQDAPEGVYGAKCGGTFTGFHGYWPSSPDQVEEHWGDEAKLRELVDQAHARGMRVLVDWVGNHVHDEHPYAVDHADWFNDERLCNDANNWDAIPETCWFDPFLPDVNYYDPAPLERMVDDAVRFAKTYDLDGYRVDAVKHMPHSVYANLAAGVAAEIEHGAFDFYTVGETFDGDRGLIASYVGERQLDAQFDFPHYFTLRAALIDGASLKDLEASFQSSRAVYGDAVMSSFLGNHDVGRFLTVAGQGDWGSCAAADRLHDPAQPIDNDEPYLKLKLGWTWLLANEGLPLVYYGDEIGLPGHNDPDNRQPMRFSGLSAREASVLDHVRKLGQARKQHPQLSRGDRRAWWEEDTVLAWSRAHEGEGMIAAINRSGVERTLENGLSWAGLPSRPYRDVLSGAVVNPSGDRLSVTVPAMSSVVLVSE